MEAFVRPFTTLAWFVGGIQADNDGLDWPVVAGTNDTQLRLNLHQQCPIRRYRWAGGKCSRSRASLVLHFNLEASIKVKASNIDVESGSSLTATAMPSARPRTPRSRSQPRMSWFEERGWYHERGRQDQQHQGQSKERRRQVQECQGPLLLSYPQRDPGRQARSPPRMSG
jgi:hypothetical protein